MPVNTPHPQYDQMLGDWADARTAIAGEKAVKAQGAKYLPKPGGMDGPQFARYVERALFFGAADRTVQGLAGAIMLRPPTIDVPDKLRDRFEDIGPEGESLDEVLSSLLDEQIGVGRVGLLVDASQRVSEESTIVPYITLYQAERILSWDADVVDGREQLTQVVLEESYYGPDLDSSDPFVRIEKKRWRLLALTSMTRGTPDREAQIFSRPVYVQQVWEKQKDAQSDVEGWVMTDEIVPKGFGGNEFEYLPFVMVNPFDLKARPAKPLLVDLLSVNFSHYRNSADLEHGRHFTALPTAWAAGFTVAKGSPKLRIGSAVAWVTQEPTARAGFLEFSGKGLGHLQTGMESKEKMMAVLGARLLEEAPSHAETAHAVRMRHQGESSALGRVAAAASDAIEKALRLVFSWQFGETEVEISYALNREFSLEHLDPQTLAALQVGLQAGSLSWATYFYNLQRGRLIPDDVTEEDELKRLATPPLSMGVDPDPLPDEPDEPVMPDEGSDD